MDAKIIEARKTAFGDKFVYLIKGDEIDSLLIKFAEILQSQSEPVLQIAIDYSHWIDVDAETYSDINNSIEKRILFTHPPLSVSEQEVIDAANDVLDKAYCDCPNSTRFEKGEHYSSCPLFDLNIAVRKLAIAQKKAGE